MLNPAYIVDVKLSIELLKYLIDRADESTWLTLEGNLCQFQARNLIGVVRDDARPAKGDWFSSGYGRVAIPLYRENLNEIKNDVLPRVGIRTLICTVCLERDGAHLFAAYDRFTQGAFLSNWLTIDCLEHLQHNGVIKLCRTPILEG